MLYDCRDIGGFLEVALVWIHQNLYRTQWPRVGNNIDSRDLEITGLFTVT